MSSTTHSKLNKAGSPANHVYLKSVPPYLGFGDSMMGEKGREEGDQRGE